MLVPDKQTQKKKQFNEHALKMQLKDLGMRLKFYLEQRGVNLETVHRLSGLSKKELHEIIDGKRFAIKNLLPVLETLSDLNGRWLIYGEGDMLKKNQVKNAPDTERVLKLKPEWQNITLQEQLLVKLSALENGQKKIMKQNLKIIRMLKKEAST